jgi:hypothetical protein
MELSQSHDMDHEFCGLVRLTQVFFCYILIEYFFSISSLNIELIENYNLFIFIFFLLSYLGLTRFDRLIRVDSTYFFVFIFFSI